jgi:radical SAM superfamily enzyme YgiQ (UPF0313 family)
MLKILIILPDARIHKFTLGPWHTSFREAPLTATSLAAFVPDDLDTHITIVDESIQKIPWKRCFDLVAISCMTGTADRAYEIADTYRKRNIPVIIGGVHATLMTDEARNHADSIVVGFAERSWPQLLKDLMKGELKPEYRDLSVQFDHLPPPRRDLQKKSGYAVPNVIQATRGCKESCDFCSVPAAGYGWHVRPVTEIINEVASVRSRRIVFNDVSMGEDMDYFKELLRAMIPLKKRWGGLVSTKAFRDPEVPGLLRDSGCVYILIGFESLNNASLKFINKGFNKYQEYRNIIKTLRELNIILMGCFIFGFEEDDENVFERTVEFVQENRIDIPRYAVYTPYPMTQSFLRLKKEGRLLHENWRLYDTQHVVFQPKLMSPEALDEGFRWAYRKTFTFSSSFHRTVKSGMNFFITFAGNLAYMKYIRRLQLENDRIIRQVIT